MTLFGLFLLILVLVFVFLGRIRLIDGSMGVCFFLARCWFRAQRKNLQVGSINWSYLEAGNPDKPTMLLIHGFGVDKYNWLPYLPQLAQDFHIIVPDLPAFGETTFSTDINSFSANEQVERLEKFIRALNILEPFHLAGNSMGGLLSGLYAVANQDKVKTLALLDPVGLAADKESFLFSAYDQGEYKLIPRTVEEGQEVINRVVAHPQKVPGFFLSYMLRKQEARREILEAIYGLVVKYQRTALLDQSLKALKIPVLIIWGQEDQLLDVSGGINAMSSLANGVLVILENVGHAPMMESPEITASHHKKFITDNEV